MKMPVAVTTGQASHRRSRCARPPAEIERNTSMIHPAAIFFLACMGGLAGLGLAYAALHLLIRWGVFKEHRR